MTPFSGMAGAVWPLLLAAVGFFVGLTLIVSGPRGPGSLSVVSEFDVWAVLIGAQTGLWAVLAPASARALCDLWAHYKVPWLPPVLLHVALAATVLAGLVAFGGPARSVDVLAPYSWRIRLLTVVGFLVALPAVVGIWSVSPALGRLEAKVGPSGTAWSEAHAEVVRGLIQLRSVLRRLLGALGAIVAALTLAAGAQRNAVLAWGEEVGPSVDFPAVAVILYGLLFTALVALIYLPAHARLDGAAQAFVDHHFPVPDAKPEAAWYSERASLERLLGLGARPGEAFQAGLSIFAPLSAGLLSTVLPG